MKVAVSYPAFKEKYDNSENYQYLEMDSDTVFESRARILYIPFEGRIDKSSFQIILSHIQTKNYLQHLILISSPPSHQAEMHKYLLDNEINFKLHQPDPNQGNLFSISGSNIEVTLEGLENV